MRGEMSALQKPRNKPAVRRARAEDNASALTILAQVGNERDQAILIDCVWLTQGEVAQLHNVSRPTVNRIALQYAKVLRVLEANAERMQEHQASAVEQVAVGAAKDYLVNGKSTRGGMKIGSVHDLSFILSAATQANKIAKSHTQPGPAQDDPLSDRLASADAAFDAPPDRSTVPVSPPISGAPNATDTGAGT